MLQDADLVEAQDASGLQLPTGKSHYFQPATPTEVAPRGSATAAAAGGSFGAARAAAGGVRSTSAALPPPHRPAGPRPRPPGHAPPCHTWDAMRGVWSHTPRPVKSAAAAAAAAAFAAAGGSSPLAGQNRDQGDRVGTTLEEAAGGSSPLEEVVAEKDGVHLHLNPNAATGYKGVYTRTPRASAQRTYYVKISLNGAQKTVGYANNAVDAAVIYARHMAAHAQPIIADDFHLACFERHFDVQIPGKHYHDLKKPRSQEIYDELKADGYTGTFSDLTKWMYRHFSMEKSKRSKSCGQGSHSLTNSTIRLGHGTTGGFVWSGIMYKDGLFNGGCLMSQRSGRE